MSPMAGNGFAFSTEGLCIPVAYKMSAIPALTKSLNTTIKSLEGMAESAALQHRSFHG
jgi:hypothetical protein